MVILRKYKFDFLHEGHNQQPNTQRKKLDSISGQLVSYIKIQTLPNI